MHKTLENDFNREAGPYRGVPGLAEHDFGISYNGPNGTPTARKADLIIDADGRRAVIDYKAHVVHNPETGEIKTWGYNSETKKLEMHRSDQLADYESGSHALGDADNVDVYITSYETGRIYKHDRSQGWIRID